jgi:flavin-binding protein dodecin
MGLCTASCSRAPADSLHEFHRAWAAPLPQVLVAVDSPRELTPAAVAAVEEAAAANDDLKFFVTTKQDGQVGIGHSMGCGVRTALRTTPMRRCNPPEPSNTPLNSNRCP